jgi:hypothetical protein
VTGTAGASFGYRVGVPQTQTSYTWTPTVGLAWGPNSAARCVGMRACRRIDRSWSAS